MLLNLMLLWTSKKRSNFHKMFSIIITVLSVVLPLFVSAAFRKLYWVYFSMHLNLAHLTSDPIYILHMCTSLMFTPKCIIFTVLYIS